MADLPELPWTCIGAVGRRRQTYRIEPMRGMPHAQAAHDDVVNAVMTDHYIVRRQSNRDLLAPRREVHDSDETAYKGEVVLLYPRQPPANGELSLYLDVCAGN